MRSSRRQLLAAAGLAALSGCAGSEERPRPPADLGVLGPLLAVERMSAGWYARAERRLRGPELELVRTLRAHEQEHVLGLEQALRDLGADPAGGAVPLPAVPRRDVAAAALRMEQKAIAAQAAALGALRSPDLRATVASMIAAQAGHAAALRMLIDRDPLGGGL